MDGELKNPRIFSAIKEAIEAHPRATGINVYLGDDEWESLSALLKMFGVEWRGGPISYNPRTGERAEFMECPIFRVDASTHLSVGVTVNLSDNSSTTTSND